MNESLVEKLEYGNKLIFNILMKFKSNKSNGIMESPRLEKYMNKELDKSNRQIFYLKINNTLRPIHDNTDGSPVAISENSGS